MASLTKMDTKNSKSTLPQGDARSDKSQITPKRSRGFENANINDSDDSDSPLSDTPDTLNLEDNASSILNSHPAQMPEDDLQKALLREDIIITALDLPIKHRHKHMPDCFNRRGRLYTQFRSYNEDIRKAREARKATNQQQSLDGEISLETIMPDGANKQPEQQEVQMAEAKPTIVLSNKANQPLEQEDERMKNNQAIVLKNRRQPPIDTGGISCQQCRKNEQRCERFVDSAIGLNCLSCFHSGEVCSLSTGRKLRRPKIDIPSKPQLHSQPHLRLQPQPHSKIEIHLKADIQSRSQKQSHRSTTHESASQRASKIRRPPRSSKPNASSHATIDSIAAPYSSEEPIVSKAVHHTTTLPSDPTSTITADNTAQQRDHQVAAQTVHETLQRQLARVVTTCNTCLESPCSCDPRPPSPEDILCNGELCFKKRFGSDYLKKYVGIQLSDARDFRRNYGFWYCPECSYKKAIHDSRGPNVFASHCTLPKFGSESLDDEEVSNSFNEFWGLINQYIWMAKKNTAPRSMRMQPLLQIPCIRDEVSDERYSPLIYALRRILKVDPGILVKEMVVSSQLQDLESSAWMRAVLVFLFFEFVFQTPSPFDDVAIWRKGLVHSFKPELAEMWVQDNRIRNMQENTGAYQARRKERREKHVRQLNAAMMPLVGGIGGNEGIHGIHMRIADIAGDLNAKFSAYTGTFEDIMPGIGDRFDPEIHVSDDPLDEYRDLSGRHIMLTTMVGVRFRIPGKPWRICSKAKVRLWPSSDQASGSLETSLPSAAGPSDRQAGSRKRPYHDLISPSER